MKTECERKEIIDTINVLLNQAYDGTLDEILVLFKKNEDEGNEDIQINGIVPWE